MIRYPYISSHFMLNEINSYSNQHMYWFYYQFPPQNQTNFYFEIQKSQIKDLAKQNLKDSTETQKLLKQRKEHIQSLNIKKSLDLEAQKNEISNIRSLKVRQKYGRNINSNIFRSLIKRISSENIFKKLALKAIQNNRLNIRYEKFIEELLEMSQKLGSYVKKHEMKSFISSNDKFNPNEEFCILFRILARVYLKQQHTLNIFYSKKISKQSRNFHFALVRQMEQILK